MNENREYWSQCRMIYDASTEEICYDLPESVKEGLHEFIRKIGKRPEYNVWYDELTPRVFGADETYVRSLGKSNEASFLDSRDNFVYSKKYGIPSLGKYRDFIEISNGVNINRDGFYEAHPAMKKYKDSTILIVAGGPSTNHCDWESEQRDYTWSCNHFYKNERIANSKVDLFYINSETHMGIPELHEYIKKNNTICAADTTISRPEHVLKSFKQEGCDTVLFATRMFLSSGAGPKLVSLALLAGAKEIKLVGIDGWTKQQVMTRNAGEHAFEQGKKLKISANYTYNMQRRENVVFWDYLLTQYPKIKFKNLGESYKNNTHAEITKKILS